MRPYIGGSQDNSFLSVTFGYNGLGRINGNETGSVGGANGWGETGLTRMFSSQVGGQISWLIPSALVLASTCGAGCPAPTSAARHTSSGVDGCSSPC
jgi:hypothetical protein